MKQGYAPLIVFLTVVQSVMFFVHYAVYCAFTYAFDAGFLLPFIQITFFALSCLFFFATFLTHHYHNIISRFFYKAASIWLGFLFYLFFTSVLVGVVALAGAFFSLPIKAEFVSKVLFLFSLFVSLYGFTHAQRLRVTSISVALPNIPESWKSRKAVFVSDIHLGQVRGKKFMKKVVHAINALSPDIVFIGGDLYDGVRVNESDVISPLADLSASLGTYFITGNHEYVSGAVAKYIEPIKELGINVLHDELVEIDGLQIVGVDYRDTALKEEYREVLRTMGIEREKPTILLKHTPFHIDIAEEHGVNLQMSGHTHRAQVFPANLITSRVFKGFDYGHKKFNLMDVYTSSGVGTWGPPVRVGSPSEIVHIHFI
jgi:uncharacterized protein